MTGILFTHSTDVAVDHPLVVDVRDRASALLKLGDCLVGKHYSLPPFRMH